jgi:hypothetical protein
MSIVNRNVYVAICTVAATLPCMAGEVQDTAASCKSVTNLQKRIVERADQGMDSLRSFVRMTNIIHGVGMVDVKESLDDWRSAVECQQRVARAAAKVEVAVQVDEPAR